MAQAATGDPNSAAVQGFFEIDPSRGDLAAADARLHLAFALHVPCRHPDPGSRRSRRAVPPFTDCT